MNLAVAQQIDSLTFCHKPSVQGNRAIYGLSRATQGEDAYLPLSIQ